MPGDYCLFSFFFRDIKAFVVGRVTEAGVNTNLFLLQIKAVRCLN